MFTDLTMAYHGHCKQVSVFNNLLIHINSLGSFFIGVIFNNK